VPIFEICTHSKGKLKKDTSEAPKLITLLSRFNTVTLQRTGPLRTHDALSVPYVPNTLRSQFLSPDVQGVESGTHVECNVLLDVAPNANSAIGGCSPKGQDRYHRNLCPRGLQRDSQAF